jgi:long-chain acyl-CoA synthetase
MATHVNPPATAGAEVAPRGERSYAANPAELPPGTLVDLFFTAIDGYDSDDALRFRADDGWHSIPHRAVLADVRALAAALERLGVQRGDRVGLLGENRPEWAIVDYALLCSGALNVPLYPTLPANQIAYILKHSGARVVFVSTPDQAAKIAEARADLSELEHVIVFDEVAGMPRLRALLDEARDALGDDEFRRRAKQAMPDDVATIIYTSGTTGEPKGVMLTHNNIHSNVQAVGRIVENGPGDSALSFLPLSHVFQRMVDYVMFARGTTIAYVANIEDVAQALVEVRPTITVAVPRVYEKLYAKILSATGIKRRLVLWARQVAFDWSDETLAGRSPGPGLKLRHALADRLVFSKLRAKLGGRLRYFVSGGAPLGTQIARFFNGAGVLILEGYGLTETSPVTNCNTPTELRIGTVGKPIPGTEIRIAEDGEILIRGPQIMKGYYRNPDATRAAIDEDGWFRTGDIGAIDADGYLRITDRKKELLVTAGGKNIAPQPLENTAKQSRFVAEAVMIGDRRPFPIMLIVPNFDTLETWARTEGIRCASRAELIREPRTLARIEEDVQPRLASFARYELPKKFVLLEREFSLETGEITPTLKVKRRVIEQRFSDRIEAAYGEADAG